MTKKNISSSREIKTKLSEKYQNPLSFRSQFSFAVGKSLVRLKIKVLMCWHISSFKFCKDIFVKSYFCAVKSSLFRCKNVTLFKTETFRSIYVKIEMKNKQFNWLNWEVYLIWRKSDKHTKQWKKSSCSIIDWKWS